MERRQRYANYINPVKSNYRILTPKQSKDFYGYVKNKAKKLPSRPNKTNELIIMILFRGLSGENLRSLNIEHLPCYHGEPSIIVYKRRTSKTRQVYLYNDDGLETKLNEYVQEYRQSANPSEPLFITRGGNRMPCGQLHTKLNILAGKIGIKHITAGVFRETVKYQVAGRISLNKNTDKMWLKGTGIALRKFMQTCCKGNWDKNDLQFFRKSLNNAHTKGIIKLPKPVVPWKKENNRGQVKKYHILALLTAWAKYRDKLPELPALEAKREKIVLKMYHDNSEESGSF